jgi:hypothetical protein
VIGACGFAAHVGLLPLTLPARARLALLVDSQDDATPAIRPTPNCVSVRRKACHVNGDIVVRSVAWATGMAASTN